jgi:DNA-binding IclR family transcriptional regulator
MEKTLAKGLAVLEALVRRGEPCGVSDLAAELGISKSNAHRLLTTLLETGFAQTDEGRYKASLKTWELGTQVIAGYDVRDLARPAMTRLVQETAEGVRLTVLDPTRLEVVYIDKIDSPQDVRTFGEIGARAPAHCTSCGKVLLAFQDDDIVRRTLRKMKAYTERTITDPAVLMRELKRVRTEGYAVNNREYSPQVAGVAAPIFDRDGRAVAALSIAAPADRLRPAVLKRTIAILRDAAASVTGQVQPVPGNVVPLADEMLTRRPRKAPGVRRRPARESA